MKKIMLVCVAMFTLAAITACKSGVAHEEAVANNTEDTAIKVVINTENTSVVTSSDEQSNVWACGQITCLVSGVVADIKTHKGIADAEVVGLAGAEVSIPNSVNRCSGDGKFRLCLKEGKRQISIKTAGCDTILNIVITAMDSCIHLDTIFLRGE